MADDDMDNLVIDEWLCRCGDHYQIDCIEEDADGVIYYSAQCPTCNRQIIRIEGISEDDTP